ncbi:MAG: hypothetical protein V2A66_09940 [Pseudomonadota bacterium]
MTIEKINPQLVPQLGANKKGTKMKGMSSGPDFNSMMDAIGAMGPTAMTAGQVYGGTNSAAVLSAAFSGIGAASGSIGGGGAYGASVGGGMSGGAPYLAAGMGYKGDSIGAGGLSGTNAVAGANGMSQMDMINTMNSNNLQLLELQAVMQNNMQSWNTKSNILSADHRARMSMIEKFQAR